MEYMNKDTNIPDRFWAKVNKTETCWLWTAQIDAKGYGRFAVNSRPVRAHRFAFERLVGPIPVGLELDHLCRVTSCCNPSHLEAVTPAENKRRARKTHCLRGHEFTTENTRPARDGTRLCRECRRLHKAAYYLRKKERRQAMESLNYPAYLFQRRLKSAESLKDKFPLAEKFERQYQQDLAAAGASDAQDAA